MELKDIVTKQRIEKIHPKLRVELTTIVKELELRNVDIRIVQGLRTFKEQDDLYAQGRTTPGNKVTNAKGGESYHNYGLSVDFVLLHKDGKISWDMKEDMDNDKKADWMEVVEVFTKYNWSWGGLWKTPDNPHFEKTFGNNFRTLLNLPKDKDGYPLL